MNILSSSADIVQKALQQKGLTCEVLELSSSTRTAQDAAQTIGCEVGQIVKSLMFCTKDGKKPILILASGKNRVNEKVIELEIGEKIEKADANFTREITGFAIGGIPPVGHKTEIEHVFIDQSLLDYDLIWAAAGTPFAVFSMPADLLEKATRGKFVRF